MVRECQLAIRRVIIVVALVLFPARAPAADEHPATQPAEIAGSELLHVRGDVQFPRDFDPTDAYDLTKVKGWVVYVNKRLIAEHAELAHQTVELLEFQLYQITRMVPAPALEKIRTVPIWLENEDPLVPCMCYHPDRHWLTSHGLNPAKARCVEIGNARRFLEWEKTQPWMVLHELAHAYHDQFLPDGFDNADVQAAFESARDQKLYDHVLRGNGHTEKAYAMTNRMEYFAECSEAFFGTNDFYPFVRAEFKERDLKGYETLRRAWGLQPPQRGAEERRRRKPNPDNLWAMGGYEMSTLIHAGKENPRQRQGPDPDGAGQGDDRRRQRREPGQRAPLRRPCTGQTLPVHERSFSIDGCGIRRCITRRCSSKKASTLQRHFAT